MGVAFLCLLCLVPCIKAEDTAKLPKANASRLTCDEQGLAYLNIKTKRKTAEGYEDNVRKVLFSGIAFTEGDNWRAEVTYKEGILDGEVVVVANNKLLSRFRYERGKKVVD
jgi:hypothetical protein